MSKWLIIGSGGFVGGSLLPEAPKSLIKGILTHQPIRAVGLVKTYNLKLYENLEEAVADGINTVYICSSTWTHFDWVKKAVKAEFTNIYSEKPVIINNDDLVDFRGLSEKFSGVMIKREHKNIDFKAEKLFLEFKGMAINSPDFLDPRRGNFLFNELIHAVDIVREFVKDNYNIAVSGNRIKGQIVYSGKKEAVIKYNFAVNENSNPLPFYRDLIQNIFKKPDKVIIPAKQLIPLYEDLFFIKKQLTNIT